ncbi:MAG: polysaccharide deacetylase family protein [Anaerolineae bacterium]|nr:polysaccharide deacetylase family protein [Anaerolineae bacterium]
MRQSISSCFTLITVILLTACRTDAAPNPLPAPTTSVARQTTPAAVTKPDTPVSAATPTATPTPVDEATLVSEATPPPTPTSTHTVTPASEATPESETTPVSAATPVSTATPTVIPSPTLPPNLLGSVLVLEYHLIREPEDRWQRTPDNFRADLERLHAEGYTPANIIDLALGFPNLPAGRKPVVLTFDDSDISQFRYLENGTIDPDSAVGILEAFHRQHPEDWPLKGTFYVLQDVNVPDRILFGQKELQDQKLRWLVDNGFEVASHTISHFNLTEGSDDQVQWQLAVSQRQLEARLPGYDVQSLSVPFGNYPLNETLVAQGMWEGEPYTYRSTVMVSGGASPSPHSVEFNPHYIPRVQALQTELDYWLGYFAQNPQFYYVSAGPTEP